MMTLLQRALLNNKLGVRSLRSRGSLRRSPQYDRATGQRHESSKPPSTPSSSSSGTSSRPPTPTTTPPRPEAPPIDVPSPINPWYQRLGHLTTFFSWFHRTQTKRPYAVQISTTLITYLCGDLLAQEIGGEEYDGWRTVRMLTIGGVASIPGYKWFIWLGNNFNYTSRWLSILTKVCVQQAVFTPVFNTYFFGMQAVLTGEAPSGVLERIKAAVPTSMWNSLKLWPAVTAFSFAFVMPQYRFMFSGLFAVCWQAYLSFLNRSKEMSGGGVGGMRERAMRIGEEKMGVEEKGR